jgi:D-aspartate ligase
VGGHKRSGVSATLSAGPPSSSMLRPRSVPLSSFSIGHRMGPTEEGEQTRRVGAIVFGGDYQGLGIVRSLGRRGVPSCVIDDEFSITRFSRYATYTARAKNLRTEQATLDALIDADRRFGLRGWVLYPTRDETVAALARNRAGLAERFRVPTPAWATTRIASDKANTYQYATRLNIPTPRTWCPRDLSDLSEIDSEGPWVIKPAVKDEFFYATGAKAWRADTRMDLVALFGTASAIARPGGVLVQELIPGGGSHQFAYCCLFKEGRSVACMSVRRCRQHPPDFGRASTYVETVDIPVLRRLAEAFLRAIDYYGLVEVEFKQDPRDGEYKLLDVNARTWGYHSLSQCAGVDFPYLLFADQTGAAVTQCEARSGVRWMRLATDLPTSLLEISRRQLGLREYVRSLRECDVEAAFSREDPVPGVMDLVAIPYLAWKRGF